ncbi:MAG: hypothetical protein AB4042_14105 [Leptolyngbyaceae cyanobacterium]
MDGVGAIAFLWELGVRVGGDMRRRSPPLYARCTHQKNPVLSCFRQHRTELAG